MRSATFDPPELYILECFQIHVVNIPRLTLSGELRSQNFANERDESVVTGVTLASPGFSKVDWVFVDVSKLPFETRFAAETPPTPKASAQSASGNVK
jgi:hypothetical protein